MIAAFSISFHSIIISSIKTNFIHYSNLKLRKRIKLGSVLNCAILSFCKHCETLHILVGKAVVHLPPVLTIEDFLIFLGIISSWPHFCKLWKTEVWPASSCWLMQIIANWNKTWLSLHSSFMKGTCSTLYGVLFYASQYRISVTGLSFLPWNEIHINH